MAEQSVGNRVTDGIAAPSPHEQPGVWAPRLARVLDEQCRLYEQLDELSQHQSVCVESGETELLLDVLAQRQGVVEQVTEVNGLLEPFVSRWDSLAGALDDSQRDALRTKLARLDELVERISKRDEEDRQKLEAQKGQVAKELGSAVRQKNAAAAYGRSGGVQPGPRFQDRQG
ncbi:MAG: flagellar export chaperone FlgN [Phycisphaerales bacterium JB065]